MEKKSFDFYQDVKVTIWQRQHFSIEADSREEAIAIAKGYSDSDVSFNDEVEVDEVEWLYDTEEHITPEKNGGEATIEVYEYISKYNSPMIADNALKGKSNVNENRDVLGYQLYDEDGNLPDGLFSFMVFRSEKNARDYMECEKLEGFSISKYYEGDIEDPTFIGLRILKKGERVFNDEPCEGDSDLRDWATVCEDTAVLYADQIVLLDMENGGENETDACSVYQIAEGRVCPKCGGPLCIEHDPEVDYPYYCPECDENFYICEVE